MRSENRGVRYKEISKHVTQLDVIILKAEMRLNRQLSTLQGTKILLSTRRVL
jgi:hypothetical protein